MFRLENLSARRREITLVLSSLLFIFTTSVALWILRLNSPNYSFHGQNHPPAWDIGPLDTVEITFENSVHYPLDTALGWKEWNSTVPSGGGMLYLGNDFTPFSISMFHQLRCLNIIREGLVQFRNSGRRETPNDLVHHCMNYIRQMILCRADTRLEYARHLARGIAVSDITHTCKDWTAIYQAAEKNYQMYLQAS